MSVIHYKTIGIIHTPFTSADATPIQPTGAAGVKGTIHIKQEYQDGLQDLDGFGKIIVLYHLHHVQQEHLVVTPFLDSRSHGVFATRAPTRPNPIGLSILTLNRVEQNILHVENVDMLNESPVIDIKPYIPSVDSFADEHIGWLAKAHEQFKHAQSDNRFSKNR